MPPRPTSAARAPGPAHVSWIHARISGRSTKSGSGANGTVEKGSCFRLGPSAAGVSIDVDVRMAYGRGPALHYGVASEVVVHGGASLEVRANNDVVGGNGSIEVA
jgi:hypothetical protein